MKNKSYKSTAENLSYAKGYDAGKRKADKDNGFSSEPWCNVFVSVLQSGVFPDEMPSTEKVKAARKLAVQATKYLR